MLLTWWNINKYWNASQLNIFSISVMNHNMNNSHCLHPPCAATKKKICSVSQNICSATLIFCRRSHNIGSLSQNICSESQNIHNLIHNICRISRNICCVSHNICNMCLTMFEVCLSIFAVCLTVSKLKCEVHHSYVQGGEGVNRQNYKEWECCVVLVD